MHKVALIVVGMVLAFCIAAIILRLSQEPPAPRPGQQIIPPAATPRAPR